MDILKQYAGVPDAMIFDSLCKADSIINRKGFRHICASISGGSDSDIVLDICNKIDIGRQIRYSWFDTGLEYGATKEHLKLLESRYSISINRTKAVIPVPGCCHKYGVPFLSKQVSENIERLQRHHFRWEDAPYEYLAAKYPLCSASIKWWCNRYDKAEYPGHSIFSIGRNKGLKEFLVRHPPRFPISSKCCLYSKKCTAADIDATNRTDLSILGIRRAEGGIRSAAYKGCFSTLRHTGISEYRPLFWYTAETKRIYEECFDIVHSRCYLEYGMTRTGCAGCPYNRRILEELPVIQFFEPMLYAAVINTFGESYRYTRMYRDFVKDYYANEKSGQEPVSSGSHPLSITTQKIQTKNIPYLRCLSNKNAEPEQLPSVLHPHAVISDLLCFTKFNMFFDICQIRFFLYQLDISYGRYNSISLLSEKSKISLLHKYGLSIATFSLLSRFFFSIFL